MNLLQRQVSPFKHSKKFSGEDPDGDLPQIHVGGKGSPN